MARIAVIGSGIAGLSAAYDLKAAGHDVTVHERSDIPGGRMADRIVNGICTHTGASGFFSFNKEMLTLVDEVGLRDDLVEFRDDAFGTVVDNGDKLYDIRLTFSPSYLLTHPAFGAKTKSRLALMLPDIVRARRRTDPCLMQTAVDLDDESVTDYVTRKVSSEFLENYVEPYFRAPGHWEPEWLSRGLFLSFMAHALGAKQLSFRLGIGQLTRTLAQRVTVRCNEEVRSIEPAEDGCSVRFCATDGAERVERYDLVVCAVEGSRVAALLPREATPSLFADVRYTRGARVYYALSDRNFKDRSQWYTRRSASRLSLFGAFANDSIVPAGFVQPGYLQCELTPQLSEEIAREALQHRLDACVRDDVARIAPELHPRIVSCAEQWWDDMIPLWYPGFARKAAAFLESQDRARARIYFCGDYLSQPHAGAACASGRNVARTVIEHWRGA